MDERTYWQALEVRIQREFAGMPERHRRYWACDGFAPGEYRLNDPCPKVTGITWILDEDKMENWHFTLFLDKPYASREEIHWAALLPPDDVTCWIAIDEAGNEIQFEPGAAVPDFPTSN